MNKLLIITICSAILSNCAVYKQSIAKYGYGFTDACRPYGGSATRSTKGYSVPCAKKGWYSYKGEIRRMEETPCILKSTGNHVLRVMLLPDVCYKIPDEDTK